MQSISFSSTQSAVAQPAQASLLKRIIAAFALARSRKQLGALEAHQLADLGISQRAADAEANRSVWDVPAHWTK